MFTKRQLAAVNKVRREKKTSAIQNKTTSPEGV